MARPYMVTSDDRTIGVDGWDAAHLHVEMLRAHGETGVEIHTR